MIEEKIKIKCSKCSMIFRERAQNLRNGFQTNCQHCNRLITFDTNSEEILIEMDKNADEHNAGMVGFAAWQDAADAGLYSGAGLRVDPSAYL